MCNVMEPPSSFLAFGTDWFYVAVPVLTLLGVLAVLARRSPLPKPAGPLRRASHGAAALTGLPPWCAGPLVILAGALIIAVQGFLWDVAWHIDIGRDEFLFSPPHVCLLLGLSLIGVAGMVGAGVATRDTSPADRVGWKVDKWRVPFGATALLVAGAAAFGGFAADELWHWAYGLDVTMWSPPHLTMISAAALSPLAGWILLAEAGPRAGKPLFRIAFHVLLAGATLIGLSAWQLEFDLGVPQWQMRYHPILVMLAAGMALTGARAALGPGWALITMGFFVAVRGALAVLTAGVWGLSIPRFVPYLASAVAVEAVFAALRDRTPLQRSLAAGGGIGTVGLAGAWAMTQWWAWHPWQLRPADVALCLLAAIAAAVLGGAFGRVIGHRQPGIRAGTVAVALAAVLVAVAVPLPRTAPDATAEIRTSPAGQDRITVDVTVTPADAVEGAERFEVMSWQGDGHEHARLVPTGPGRYTTEESVPVGGRWKTNLRLGHGSHVAAIPISLPADPAIGARAVPLEPVKVADFQLDPDVLLREATDGPTWPGVVGYTYVSGAILSILVLIVAGAVALDRRRRGNGWIGGTGSLVGRRVLLTGASGGIGSATRDALERHGAAVVGLDLVGGAHSELTADVCDQTAVAAAVDEAARRLGGIDTVIVNAGIGTPHDALAAPDPAVRSVMDVNFWGAWAVVAAAADHLVATHGQVVVIGSGLAVATVPYAGVYTASKRALTGYADVLRMEAGDRLTVSTVQPAFIRTAIHDASTAGGVGLDGVVRCESVTDAAAAVVTAMETGRRELGSSPLTTAELWLARRAPGITDRVLRRRWQRRAANRPTPTFIRLPADNHADHEVSAP